MVFSESQFGPVVGEDDLEREIDIPISQTFKYIIIPLWLLTAIMPAFAILTKETPARITATIIVFVFIGLMAFFMARLLNPRKIVLTDEGASVIYKGRKKQLLPWPLIDFVPRQVDFAHGFESLVGVGVKGQKGMYHNVPARVADQLKKQKEIRLVRGQRQG